MTLTSPNEKLMRVAGIVRRYCHFLLWRGEFCFHVVGNFEPKKITPNCNALQNRLFLTFESLTLHLFFLDSVKQCYLQTKKHAVTSSERAHSITWYKQKSRRNRWASKQVSRRYMYNKQWNVTVCFRFNKTNHTFSLFSKRYINCKHLF